MIDLDVKAVRTQPAEMATKRLSNSMRVFLRLLALCRRWIGKRWVSWSLPATTTSWTG